MVNSNTNNVHAKIIMNGEELEEINQFKYLGATLKKMVQAKEKSEYV